jgi:hypothetical protein
MSFIAVYGNYEPRFRVTTSLDVNALIQEAALITSADGPVLKTVNNIPAFDYLKKIGLVDESITDLAQLFAVPSIIIYENGVRTARAMLQTVQGDHKSLMAAGNTPVGAKISFALMNTEGTIRNAVKMTDEFERDKITNSLNYSCAGRSWSLGTKFLAECEAYAAYHQRLAKNGISANYILSYSGGEICPVPDKDGKLVNCLHNYTLISCVFE